MSDAGTLPIDWLAFPELRLFDAEQNLLTGTIPQPTIPFPGLDVAHSPSYLGYGGDLYADTCMPHAHGSFVAPNDDSCHGLQPLPGMMQTGS